MKRIPSVLEHPSFEMTPSQDAYYLSVCEIAPYKMCIVYRQDGVRTRAKKEGKSINW